MGMLTANGPTSQHRKPSAIKVAGSSLITLLVCPAIILLAAGDWLWLEGWILSLWFAAMIVSITIYLSIYDPELLAERSRFRPPENQKTWDKYVLWGIYVLMFAWLIIMPLDVKRFQWSPAFPVWLKVVGGLLLIPSLYFIFRATAENTFASTAVRIQAEREQRVISTGVYSFVRHPMYLGAVLMMFGAPLLLGSLWGLIVGVIALVVLVGRIIGEEKVLIEGLAGYSNYMERTRYRLMPFIW